jgi:hypothetical protein
MTTEEPTQCPNPVFDAIRSISSAIGKDITCDKAKGFTMLVVLAIVALILLKFFVFKKR